MGAISEWKDADLAQTAGVVLGRSVPFGASFPSCTLPEAGLGSLLDVLWGVGKVCFQIPASNLMQFKTDPHLG